MNLPDGMAYLFFVLNRFDPELIVAMANTLVDVLEVGLVR
jgi:hypothetical protein